MNTRWQRIAAGWIMFLAPFAIVGLFGKWLALVVGVYYQIAVFGAGMAAFIYFLVEAMRYPGVSRLVWIKLFCGYICLTLALLLVVFPYEILRAPAVLEKFFE